MDKCVAVYPGVRADEVLLVPICGIHPEELYNQIPEEYRINDATRTIAIHAGGDGINVQNSRQLSQLLVGKGIKLYYRIPVSDKNKGFPKEIKY